MSFAFFATVQHIHALGFFCHVHIYVYICPQKIRKESKYNWNFMNVFSFNFCVRHFIKSIQSWYIYTWYIYIWLLVYIYMIVQDLEYPSHLIPNLLWEKSLNPYIFFHHHFLLWREIISPNHAYSTEASDRSFYPIFNKRFDHLETMLTICRPKKVLPAGSLCGPFVPSPQSKCP